MQLHKVLLLEITVSKPLEPLQAIQMRRVQLKVVLLHKMPHVLKVREVLEILLEAERIPEAKYQLLKKMPERNFGHFFYSSKKF